MDSSRNVSKKVAAEKRAQWGQSLFWTALFVLCAVYAVAYAVKMYLRNPLPETEVVFGSVGAPITSSGVIIRDETVYFADARGTAVYAFADGDRLKKGDAAAGVEDAERVKYLESELTSLDESIFNRQTDAADGGAFAEDVKKANGAVKKIVDYTAFDMTAVGSAAWTGDFTPLLNAVDKMSETLNFRNTMLFGAGGADTRSLTQRRSTVGDALANAKNPVKAEKSGIFSTRADGYEAVFTPETMTRVSVEATRLEVTPVNLGLTRDAVNSGDPLFRVINANEWYVAAYVPQTLTEDWEEGDAVTVEIERDGAFHPYEGRVYHIEKPVPSKSAAGADAAEMFVVLRFTKFMTEFMNERVVSLKLPQGVTEGLKVPKSAVAERTYVRIPSECVFKYDDGRQAVRRLTEKGEETVFITVKKEEGGNVFVLLDYNRIAVGDELSIIGGLGKTVILKDIENVSGVFVTNTGAAVFCEIKEAAGFVENAEYILLDPAENRGLRAHDKIVSDARYAGEEIIVY